MERSAVRTLSYLLATIGLYLLLWQTILTRIDLPDYYYGRLIELLGLSLFIALALRTPMKFDQMGIVTDKRTLLRSLAMGSTVALIAIAFFALPWRGSSRLKSGVLRPVCHHFITIAGFLQVFFTSRSKWERTQGRNA